MGNRNDGVGKRGQIVPNLRRIVGLGNENRGKLDRSSTSALETSVVRQAPKAPFGTPDTPAAMRWRNCHGAERN